MDAQAVGRGPRTCAHHLLSPEERVVHIHRYFAVAPSPHIDRSIHDEIKVAKEAFQVYKQAKMRLAQLKRGRKKDQPHDIEERKREQEDIMRDAMRIAEPVYGRSMRQKKLKREEAINQWARVPDTEKMVDRFINHQAMNRDAPLQTMLKLEICP